MHQIVVTHGFVKKLAHNIRDRYGRNVRHTEVIELIAAALGHKAGPLMHSLKMSGGNADEQHEQAEKSAHDGTAGRIRYLDDEYKVITRSGELTAAQMELVALVSNKAGSPSFLLTAAGHETSPEVASARTYLRRRGYHWFAAPSVDRLHVAAAYAKGQLTNPSLGTTNKTAAVRAVCNVLTAIREKDMDALALFVPLLAPATPVAKFVLAYARRQREREQRDTRAVMSMLLDAFYEDQFLVQLAATSVVPDAITDDAFSAFSRSFDYGENLKSEIMSGMFPKTMLAWAAAHAVEHDFLRFDGSRAVVLHPPVHPKLYGYQRSAPTWHVDPTLGKVSDGRESFLRHLCDKEIDQFAKRMDHWHSPDEFDLDKAVARLLEKFATEAVVGGAWTLEKAEAYMRAVLPKRLAMRYQKPY